MKRSVSAAMALSGLLAWPDTGGAQTRSAASIDQISAPTPRVDAVSAAPGAEGQRRPARPGADPESRIAAGRETGHVTVTAEILRRCEEAVAGRGAGPDGVNCPFVVQAAALSRQSLSAEQALLGVTLGQVQARPGASRVPDADAVARRPLSGDVQNNPYAQAVGAAFENQREAPPPPPTPTPTPDPD